MAKIDTVQEVATAENLEIKTMRLDMITPYPNNPRIIDKGVPQVMESINQLGYITPIVVDEDGVILAGHTRHRALQELGIKSAEVIVAHGLTEDQKRKYRLLDNKTGELASWDMRKLTEELQGIDFEGYDFGQPLMPENYEEGGEASRTEKAPVICPRCGGVVE